MQITVGPENIEGLLSGRIRLMVPSFQRSYSWTKPQIEQFLKDVMDSTELGEPHFYGPVVLLRLPSDPDEYRIVDGQQRITTVVMTLAILRDLASQFDDSSLDQGLPHKVDVLQVLRTPLFLPPLLVQPRFTASYSIEDIFNQYVIADPSDKRPVLTVGGAGMTSTDTRATRELRRAYIQIRDELTTRISKLQDDEAKKEWLLKVHASVTTLFEIHTMQLSDENDAYILFETLNDRGLRLNPSDLLKTLTLREIRARGSAKDVEDALNLWDSMVNNLGDYEFSRFLRHYLLTVVKGPVQANKIYALFKLRIEKAGKFGAQRNLMELAEASTSYSRLLGESQFTDQHLRASVLRMNSFSDTHRVLLMASPIGQAASDSQRRFFRAVEFLAFRWIAAGQNAQILENLYQELAHKIRKDSSDDSLDRIVSEIFVKAPKDDDLSSITRSDQIALQRYILRRIEESFGGHLSWESPISVEHLAPQNPGVNGVYWYAQIASPDVPDNAGMLYDDYVRIWGNLSLLEQKLNSSIGNAAWPRKVSGDANSNYDGLSASNLNLNKQVIAAKDWSLDQLSDRNSWIHNSILELVGQNWVKTGKAVVVKWVA